MALTQQDCERVLSGMSSPVQAKFLCRLGHELTIAGRSAYEFQAPGVKDPRLLRELNEIHHRIYAQVESLLSGLNPIFPADALASWLAGEDKSEVLQRTCLRAFERSLQNEG